MSYLDVCYLLFGFILVQIARKIASGLDFNDGSHIIGVLHPMSFSSVSRVETTEGVCTICHHIHNLHFNSQLSREPRLAVSLSVIPSTNSGRELLGHTGTVFLWTRAPSGHSSSCVKTLKETENKTLTPNCGLA